MNERIAEERRTVRDAVGLVDRSDRGRLLVRGEQRIDFLQRLVSQDVAGLDEGTGTRACLLTPKGRVLAVMTVYEMGEGFLLECPAVDRESLERRLNMYVLGAPVEIVDVTEHTGQIAVAGPRAQALLQQLGVGEVPEEALSLREVEIAGVGLTVHCSDDLGVPAWDLHGMDEEFPAVLDALTAAGAVPVSADTADLLRIEAGVPRFGAELSEEVFPPEVPWFADRAISYTKGCYVGQEVVARIRTYGHVNRELRGLVVEGEPPAAGTKVSAEGKGAGVVTSSVQIPDGPAIALALLKRDHLETGTELAVGDATARVVPAGGPWE